MVLNEMWGSPLARVDVDFMADGCRVTGIATGPGDSRAPLLLALHGGGYNARYYDLPGHPLLDLAEATRFQVTALNRPGYRGSERLPADAITFAATRRCSTARSKRCGVSPRTSAREWSSSRTPSERPSPSTSRLGTHTGPCSASRSTD